LWNHSSRSWRHGMLVSALIFLSTSAPLVLLLSRQKHRLTFGDSARLNYAWYVSPRTFWRNWQGEIPESGIPLHSTRQLSFRPPVFEFDGPIVGSYPPWTDPSYWNDGLRWHFRLRPQMEVVAGNIASELRLLLRAQPGLITGLLVLAFFSGQRCWARLRELWPLFAISAAALALYLPIHVEDRFLGGFVLVLFLGLLAAVRLRPVDQRSAAYVAVAVFITMALGTADLTLRYATRHLAIPGSGPNSTTQDVLAAEHLQQMGVRPGDKVAVIGDGTGAYWAHLANLRIVAEIMSAHHDSEEFWRAPQEVKQQVYDTFWSVHAQLLIASCPPSKPSDWTQIAGTSYCVLELREPR
jgi:hypothetical protein